MLSIVVFVYYCCFILNVNSQIIPLNFNQIISRLNQYQYISEDDLYKNVEYNLTPEEITEEISSFSILNNNITIKCKQDFDIVLGAAAAKAMWAVKVLDAWGKPLPSGVLKGNVYWIGDFNECLKPMYYPANKSFMSQPFNTQHCTVSPKTQKDRNSMPPIVLGVCVPSSCDHPGIISLLHTIYKKTNLTIGEIICSNDPANGQKNLTIGAIVTITILSILGCIVLIGTIIDLILISKLDANGNLSSDINGYDFVADGGTTQPISVHLPRYSRYSIHTIVDHIPGKLFLSEFSAWKTLRRIFTMKQKRIDTESFPFINGIRVLALFWVIIGHSLSFGLVYTRNVLDVLVWSHNIAFQLIINAVLSVDTFFVLSGFLTAILFIRQIKKEKKLSIHFILLYYIHRYIRLTPTFLLVILVSINLTPYFGSGPIYPTQQGFETTGCRTKYWWTSIVYVGNIIKPDEMCLDIAWYLHNDMQFHWIAPLMLIPYVLGKKSISYFVTTIFIFIGILSTVTILLYYPNMSLNSLDAFADQPGPTFYKNIYVTPWCRISAYAIGIFTGYCVIDVGRLYRINKFMKYFINLLLFLISLVCLFTTYPDYILSSGLNRSILVSYQSLVRTLWSICIGWILFQCSINQGGLVNKILSWSIWLPFAKLNYSCYLIHAIMIKIILYNQVIPMYYQGHLIVNNFISHILISYLTAIVVMIFFETPFFVIEKKIFKR